MVQWDTKLKPENIQDMEHSAYPTNSSVSNKQKPSTINSRKCKNCIWASVVQLVKTGKFKFELDKFLELIPDQPKMPNYVTASGSNSILDQLTHLRAQGIYQSGGVPN